MSSLHCPTRVLVARHGEAEYETELVTDDGGSLTAVGRQQSRELAERLLGERIARIWTSPLSRAVQTAEIVAAALGVDVVVREGLREYAVGALAGTDGDERAVVGAVFGAWVDGDDAATIPDGERIGDIVRRVHDVLQEVADVHRGEAVLVVSHGGAILSSVPSLVGLPRSAGHGITLANCGVIRLEADGEDWQVIDGDA